MIPCSVKSTDYMNNNYIFEGPHKVASSIPTSLRNNQKFIFDQLEVEERPEDEED